MARRQSMQQILKLHPYVLKAPDSTVTARHIAAVLPHLFLRRIQFQAFFLDKIMYQPDGFNILRRVQPPPMGITFGIYDSELFLPET